MVCSPPVVSKCLREAGIIYIIYLDYLDYLDYIKSFFFFFHTVGNFFFFFQGQPTNSMGSELKNHI